MYLRSVLASVAIAASVGPIPSSLHAQEATSTAMPAVNTDRGVSGTTAGSSMPGSHSAESFVAFSEWSSRVQGLLAKSLHYHAPLGPVTSPGTGVVRIKFNCSESGKPDKVSLVKTSGDSVLDKEAVRAMSRVATLHPLPTGFNHGQRFEALVVFATDENDARLKAVAAEQAEHNAWYHDPVRQAKAGVTDGSTVIALARSR